MDQNTYLTGEFVGYKGSKSVFQALVIAPLVLADILFFVNAFVLGEKRYGMKTIAYTDLIHLSYTEILNANHTAC